MSDASNLRPGMFRSPLEIKDFHAARARYMKALAAFTVENRSAVTDERGQVDREYAEAMFVSQGPDEYDEYVDALVKLEVARGQEAEYERRSNRILADAASRAATRMRVH